MLTMFQDRRGILKQINTCLILLVNVVTLVMGLIYLSKGEDSTIWNTFGFLIIFSLFENINLAAKEKDNVRLGRLYLLLSAVFMVLIPLINTYSSTDPNNMASQSTLSAVMLFFLFILGGSMAAGQLQNYNKNKDRKDSENPEEVWGKDTIRGNDQDHKIIWLEKIKSALYILSMIILSAILYLGLFMAINLLRINKLGFLEGFISVYALFFSFSFLSVGILILSMMNYKKYKLYYYVVQTTTIFIFIVCLLPLLFLPRLINNAGINYVTAFGDNQLSQLDYPNEYFRRQPFSLQEYFLGTPSKNYKVQENILFYQGTEGIDKDLELYYDVYSPVTDKNKLPGGNSVLIRIHGGAWTSGDKGRLNFAQMNKYFASQGYIVFDIQYGLNDVVDWLDFMEVKKSLLGNYSIDDMIRHIGIFTDYLSEHQEEYQANLNSVFLSGGSAGGQLSLAFGLAISEGRFRDFLNPNITVKGVIPFYPAIGLSLVFDIGGKEELVDPAALVTPESPPCLIYQGSHDGLVNQSIAEEFRKAYLENGNEKCAIITMPFGGHSSDLYFSGYYNQVFLYYMERFMYLYR